MKRLSLLWLFFAAILAAQLADTPGTRAIRSGKWGVEGSVRTRIVKTPTTATLKWAQARPYVTTGDINAIAAGDFNADGRADLAIATTAGIAVHSGSADARLATPLTLSTTPTTALLATDVNGDQLTDLIAATPNGVDLLLATADGFLPARHISPLVAAAIATADVNSDVIPDLLIATTSELTVLIGDVSTFTTTRQLPLASPVRQLLVADFNLDTHADILALDAREPRAHLWLADGTHTTILLPADVATLGILDQGGYAHLMLRLAGAATVQVMANDANGGFRAPVEAPGLTLDSATDLTLDLNTDGAPDRVLRTAAREFSIQPRQAGLTSLVKSHTGTWNRGDFERTFVIEAFGSGPLTLTDTVGPGMDLFNMGGPGWECTLPSPGFPTTCFYVGQTVTNGAYPPLYAFVDISPTAPDVLTNTVTDGNGVTATDTVVLGSAPAPDLTISKSHTGNFTAGQSHSYSLLVTNAGNDVTTGTVTVTELPPTGMTVASLGGTGWACQLATLTCTRADSLAAGASYPAITVGVLVAPASASPLINTATVSGGGDTTLNNNTATDSTIILQADLTISKTHSGNFTRGQTGATFTITVSNVGSASSSGAVTVSDTLPSAFTATGLAGSGWSCTLSPLSCTRADALAAGASYPAIVLTVNVSATAPTTAINIANVSGGSDSNTNNNATSDNVSITFADLTITKTHSGFFAPGALATYAITVANAGTGPTAGTVTVVDTLPAALTSPAISGPGWTCQTTPTVQCSRADALAAGASYPVITLTATVAANAPTSFTNTATVSGGGDADTSNNTATDPTTTQGPDLTISKTPNGTFSRGQSGAEWRITVTNSGGAATTGEVRVTDFPQGSGAFTITGISGSGWACTNGVEPFCTRSDSLAPGASFPPVVVTINITTDPAVTAVANLARVSNTSDTNTSNNESLSPVTLAQADLTITKTPNGTFTLGQSASWTLTVTNNGTGFTTGEVRVNDSPVVGTAPPTYSVSSLSGTGWTCTTNNIAPFCTRTDALAPGASYPPITVAVEIANAGPSSVNNSASVVFPGDTNTNNNSAFSTVPIVGPDVTITKTHTGNFLAGQPNAQFTITVSNVGNAPTTSTVTVTDTIDTSAFTNLRLAGPGWSCSGNTCSRSEALAAGASYPAITATVDVLATSSGFNRAQVSHTFDKDVTNNTAQDTATITTGTVDLTITKTPNGTFTLGQSASWTLTVTNNGTGFTTGEVRVNDSPVVGSAPPTYTVSSLSGPGWTCTTNNIAPFCTRTDALAPGASYPPITVAVAIANAGPSSVNNSASVVFSGDAITNNNSAFSTVPIVGPDVTVTKTHTGNFLAGQPNAQFTITVTNVGNAPTTSVVTVTDTIDTTAFTNLRLSGTGWSCSGTTCSRSDALAPNTSYPPITATVDVLATSSGFNRAQVSHAFDKDVTNNTAQDTATITTGTVDLTITKTPNGTFTLGQSASWTLTVTNNGTGFTTGEVRVNDSPVVGSVPPTYTVSSLSGPGWTCTTNNISPFCTRTDALAPGASYPPITVMVDIANAGPSSVSNSASVVFTGDTNTNNNSAFSTVPIVGPDVTVSKTHTGNFLAGQPNAQFTITVTNVGNAPTTSTVTVTDTIDTSAFTNLRLSGAGWSCSATSCTRSDALAPNTSYPPITATVDVLANAGATGFNTAQVASTLDKSVTNNSSQDTATITPGTVDFTITKTPAGDFVLGQLASWTITVTNLGTGPSNGEVRVNELLGLGLTLSQLSGNGWTCTRGPSVCTRTDSLAPGASYPPITATVGMHPQGIPTATNRAAVVYNGDANPNNNTAESTVITIGPDLTITKTHSGNFFRGQTNATFTINVTNNGTATSRLASVVDTIDTTAFTNLRLSGSGWTCTGTSCLSTALIAPGASYPPITATVDVLATAGPTGTNTATVAVLPDRNPADNTVTDTANIVDNTFPDLTIALDGPTSVALGQTAVRYTVTVSNRGTSFHRGTATVTITPPIGVFRNLRLSGTGWTCVDTTCTRADLLPINQDFAPLSLTADIASNGPTTNVNLSAAVSSTETESRTDNNSAPRVVQVLSASPDLTINLSSRNALSQGARGVALTYSVTNLGSQATSNPPRVVFTLPSQLTPTSMGGAGWSCNVNTRTCDLFANLAAGTSAAPLTILIDVASDAPPSLEITAAVSTTNDIDTTNNTRTNSFVVAQTSINATATLGALTFNRATARYQQSVTVQNNGPRLNSAAIALSSLSAGAVLFNRDGLTNFVTPTGSPYKELGAIPAGGTVVITLEFTRIGAVPITFTPILIGEGVR